jgi:hypothetical protein
MIKTTRNRELKLAAIKIVNGRRFIVTESVNNLSLDIILGITIILGILGLIIR